MYLDMYLPISLDFNAGENEGCGYFEVNQKQGVRWSAADAFLHPIKSRANLTVITKAHVNKIQFEGKKVTGVRFWRGYELFEASVSGETRGARKQDKKTDKKNKKLGASVAS